MKSYLIIFYLIILTSQAIGQSKTTPKLGENNIDEIIASLTLDEKVKLLIGPNYSDLKIENTNGIIGFTEKKIPGAAGITYAIPRLGIPSIVLADGPAGLRITPLRKDDPNNTYYATGFPVGNLLASTWNPEIVNAVGKAFGNEVLEYGIDIILAPGTNIQRNPLNGRNFEYYSEDPFVAGKIAASIINGLQSNGIGTSLKHFAANNQETKRLSVNAIVSERALRELYLKPFQIAIKESNPWTVMTSYNRLNGAFTAERKDLVTNILRNEWSYQGLVVTDWGAGKNVGDQIRAGHSLVMPGRLDQVESILWNVKNGKLDEKVLDDRVKKLLELIVKSPSFKKYNFSNKPDLLAHANVARVAATEGMVLLKNDNKALPFSLISVKKIATFGNTTFDLLAGGTGSGDVNKAYVVSLAKGLTNAGFEIDKQIENAYTDYISEFKANRPKLANPGAGRPQIPEFKISDSLIEQQAKTADIAIITIGKNAGEGADRDLNVNYNLMPYEKELIKSVSKAFKVYQKKTVVILNVGGVVDVNSWQDDVDAVLLAWQPGQEAGDAIVDIISGKVNPSGKLAITFPAKYQDVSSSTNFPGTPVEKPENVIYQEGIYVGYRYHDTYNVKPAYEFGYGLSYSQFQLFDLKFNSKNFKEKITVTLKVKNTGEFAGKEVVQLYLKAPSKSIDKPIQELKNFAKTQLLQPGEVQTIKMEINASDLASFVPIESAWIAEKGNYEVRIGTSSRQIALTKSFKLNKTIITEKVNHQVQPLTPILDEFNSRKLNENKAD